MTGSQNDVGADVGHLAGVPQQAEAAARALDGLKAPAEAAADAIGDAFERAGESLARSLTRAALDGEVTLQELAQAVLVAVNALGSGRSGPGGFSQAIGQVISGLIPGGFGGARAEGGPVRSGGSYLVGERGPEVFRPASTGSVEPLAFGGPSVVVNVTVDGGPEALLRSEAQIARMMARAAMIGMRRS